MKALALLLLLSCSKGVVIPEVRQDALIHPSYENKLDDSCKTTEDFIKSNTWPVTASEWNDKQGCGHIIVFIRPYIIQVLNPTHQEYLDYPIGSSIKGSVLFEMLRKRGKI